MQGRLTKLRGTWQVRYFKEELVDIEPHYCGTLLPVHPDDALDEKLRQMEGEKVEFDIMDEFTNPEHYQNVPWGDGLTCAKLKL